MPFLITCINQAQIAHINFLLKPMNNYSTYILPRKHKTFTLRV